VKGEFVEKRAASGEVIAKEYDQGLQQLALIKRYVYRIRAAPLCVWS
jgi:hypothetical protein